MVRQQTILSHFMNAISKGFPDKKIPPIEIVAHDPFRYIGDMLSLVLELAMSEKTFVEQVFRDKKGLFSFLKSSLSLIR